MTNITLFEINIESSNMANFVQKIWQKLKKKMAKGRVGVGHPLPIPTELKHCQYTYRHLPTGRSRSDPYKVLQQMLKF